MEFIELFTNILTILFLIVLLSRSDGYGKHSNKEEEVKSCGKEVKT